MLENEFIRAALGGSLIGVAASILLITQGRIAGISGITFNLLNPATKDKDWRWAFFLGLLVGGAVLAFAGEAIFGANFKIFGISESRPMWMMGLAGLLVGYGTQMGNGCTSGHGICGITRFSPRSLVATGTFMIAGFAISTVLAGVLS